MDNFIDINDYDFEFPKNLIAQRAVQRGTSRILHCPKDGSALKELASQNIADLFQPGDCLVVNNTRVIPARLLGKRPTGGAFEILLVSPQSDTQKPTWEAWVRPGKHFHPGKIQLLNDIEVHTLEIQADGTRVLEFDCSHDEFKQILAQQGKVPLPPYIEREADEEDKNAYQTVFAKNDGAVAAPTASLHFNDEILESLYQKGVQKAEVTLHVGPGTFKPVETENALDHPMHSEQYELDAQNAQIINECKKNGGRIISVGTTVTRVLETLADSDGLVHPQEGWTDIYIYPGYQWKIIDGLMTNFHWPKSTLLLLVSSFYGRNNTLQAYEHAIQNEFRLFSYGDGMLIL